MSEAIQTAATNSVPSAPHAGDASTSVEVLLPFKIDLWLLRRQKRVLMALPRHFQISASQQEALDGILNMIDFIQDSIVDQGIATEEEVFPQMPLLFEAAA